MLMRSHVTHSSKTNVCVRDCMMPLLKSDTYSCVQDDSVPFLSFFMAQQVHTQPVVTAASSTTSRPTVIVKALVFVTSSDTD